MYCVKCGQQLPDDANYCFKCGAPQRAAEVRHEFELDGVYIAQNVRTIRGRKAVLTPAELVVRLGNGQTQKIQRSQIGTYEPRAGGWLSKPSVLVAGHRGSNFALALNFLNKEDFAAFLKAFDPDMG